MHKRDGEQDGICRKFFNMIMNTIIARGIKRVTMGPTTVRSSDTVVVPLEGSDKNGPLQVLVDTDHKYGIENWVSFENHVSPIREKEALLPLSHDDRSVKGKIVKDDKSRSKDKMPMVYDHDSSDSPARDSRRTVSIIGDEKIKNGNQNETDGTDKTNAPPRTMWHLFSVDEKSDEFIRKKKEAMRKNYSLDHPR